MKLSKISSEILSVEDEKNFEVRMQYKDMDLDWAIELEINMSVVVLKFIYRIYTIRKNNGTIFVPISHLGHCNSFFPKLFDSHISDYNEWNCTKFFTKDT